jgi:hypothetical protein
MKDSCFAAMAPSHLDRFFFTPPGPVSSPDPPVSPRLRLLPSPSLVDDEANPLRSHCRRLHPAIEPCFRAHKPARRWVSAFCVSRSLIREFCSNTRAFGHSYESPTACAYVKLCRDGITIPKNLSFHIFPAARMKILDALCQFLNSCSRLW